MEWMQVQIPKPLIEEVMELLKEQPFWTNPADFVRDAVREKIVAVKTRLPITLVEKEA